MMVLVEPVVYKAIIRYDRWLSYCDEWKAGGDYYPLGVGRTSSVGMRRCHQILDNMVSRKHLQIRFDANTNKYFAFDMKAATASISITARSRERRP